MLHLSVLSKLKSKCRMNMVIDFDHDCFRRVFHGKGREARKNRYILLDKNDFVHCQLPEKWDVVCDGNGDAVRIK